MASVIVVGKRRRREHALTGAVTVIGRDAGVDLDVGDLQVSRRHALLVQATQGTFVKDLGSRNGVLVNQQRLAPRQQALLKNGDVLQIGRTTLIFKDMVAAEEEAEEPHDPTVVAPVARPAPAASPPSRSLAPAGAPREHIPRALPAQVYSGPVEVLALRALLERAEGERRTFRNLALLLVGLLFATLLVLLGTAVGGPRQAPETAAAPPETAPAEVSAPTLEAEGDRLVAVAPTARLSGPSRAGVGQTVLLSAADSAAADGAPLTHRWMLLAQPAGSIARLETQGQARAELTPDHPGRYLVALVVHDGRSPGSTQLSIEAVHPPSTAGEEGGAPDAARAARDWTRAAEALLGRALDPDERRALDAGPAARVEALLEREELYARWWEQELDHLGLTGVHRPQGEPWISVPRRLRAGQFGVPDLWFAVLVSQDWASRYPGREAYVDAALAGLLGPDPARDPELRAAARRLYDGHTARLLGQDVEDQVGLVRALAQSPQAHRAALQRAIRRALGAAPAADRLERAAEAPADGFFQALVEAVCGE